MLSEWTKHLKTEEEKIKFENHMQRSKDVLERLRGLVDERVKSIDITERSINQFKDPNWAYKQAFINGFRSSSEIVKKLTDLDQQIQRKE